MKETKQPVPVVLSGRVYVHGVLEDQFRSYRCERKAEVGAMRIHTHLDAEGQARRQRGYCAAGYSGVIRASVFDGKGWRKFMLALETTPQQRNYANNAERTDRARGVLRILAMLKGKTCIYRDGAFVVNHDVPVLAAQASAPVAQQPAPVLAQPKPLALQPAPVVTVQVAVTVTVSGAPAAQAHVDVATQADLFQLEQPTCKVSKPKQRRSRKGKKLGQNPNQPTLF